MYVLLKIVAVLSVASAAPSNTDPRIVGGVNASILEAPWQASIHYYPVNICGGSIIREDIILTASHCFARYGTNPTEHHVRVGNTKRSVGGDIYIVREIIVHPDFAVEHYNADIAVVKLANNIIYKDNVKPIALPSLNEPLPVGKNGLVTGWGYLTYNGVFPVILQKTYLPIVEQQKCIDIYNEMRTITENMFCAGTFDGKTDACNGDSGGPFVVNNKLYGIVSWGVQCAIPEYPGVFTSVSALRGWIDQQIN